VVEKTYGNNHNDKRELREDLNYMRVRKEGGSRRSYQTLGLPGVRGKRARKVKLDMRKGRGTPSGVAKSSR